MKSILSSVVFPLGILLGCSQGNPPQGGQPNTQGAPIPEVKLVSPKTQTLPRTVLQPGTVMAFEETVLHSRVTGTAGEVLVDIGDRVKGPRFTKEGKIETEGTLLVRLNAPELDEDHLHKEALVQLAKVEVELAQRKEEAAQGTVLAAEALIREAKAGMTRAQASYDRWQGEAKRVGLLVQARVLDEQTRDETINQFKAAEAQRDEMLARVALTEANAKKAKADHAFAQADILAAKARLAVAQAASRRARVLVDYCKITAPFDGVITRRKVDPGRLIHEDGANRGEPLFTVSRVDPVRVMVEVPEADGGLVAVGQDAIIRIHARSEREIKAKVGRISWALDPASRTLRAEIDLANVEGAIRPGMFVSAQIMVPLPELVVLPAGAVVRTPDGAFGFTIVEDQAVKWDLKTGRKEGDLIEILAIRKNGKDWVAPLESDLFIGAGAAGLAPGQKIKVLGK